MFLFLFSNQNDLLRFCTVSGAVHPGWSRRLRQNSAADTLFRTVASGLLGGNRALLCADHGCTRASQAARSVRYECSNHFLSLRVDLNFVIVFARSTFFSLSLHHFAPFQLVRWPGVFTTNVGRVLRPKEGDRLILYLKDLNLPRPDKYETIQLISFLQQLVTYKGFYDDNLEWLSLERVQV